MKRADKIFTLLRVPLDFILLLIAGYSAYFLRFTDFAKDAKPILFSLLLGDYSRLLFGISLGIVVLFFITGMYSLKRPAGLVADSIRMFVTVSAAILLLTFYLFITRSSFESRFILLFAWGFAAFYGMVGRAILSGIKHTMLAHGNMKLNNVLVIGNSATAKNLIHALKIHRSWGYDVKAHAEIYSEKMVVELLRSRDITDIILADQLKQNKIIGIANFCSKHALTFRFIPTSFETLASGLRFETLSGLPLFEVQRTRIEGWGSISKSIFDIIGAIIGIVIFSPLFLVIASAIKFDSEGPIIARIRHRVGKGGKPFFMLKFRSMVKNADNLKETLLDKNEREGGKGPLFKMKNDPRITRVGRFLRKYRLDELPQLFNVLGGDMTLVGPRAHEENEVEKYQEHQKIILVIKPGITGLAQISGSSDLPFEQENKLDVYYMKHWSLWLDFKILLKTVLFLFVDRSAV